jgi:hypothetical protein
MGLHLEEQELEGIVILDLKGPFQDAGTPRIRTSF